MIPPTQPTVAVASPHCIQSWSETDCPERDKIILAFLLAVNEGNNASSELDQAADEHERSYALKIIENAKGYSHALRTQVIVHCLQHGC